jgi:hypothetical protein
MKRTQIQVPDALYSQALAVADLREVSMSELVRRGLEYMISITPHPVKPEKTWEFPKAHDFGGQDFFSDENWRAKLHMSRLEAAEPPPTYTGEA